MVLLFGESRRGKNTELAKYLQKRDSTTVLRVSPNELLVSELLVRLSVGDVWLQKGLIKIQ